MVIHYGVKWTCCTNCESLSAILVSTYQIEHVPTFRVGPYKSVPIFKAGLVSIWETLLLYIESQVEERLFV